jgi:hypothetical protein
VEIDSLKEIYASNCLKCLDLPKGLIGFINLETI